MNDMSMKIDGEEVYSQKNKVVIIDSGTSFNLMPTNDVRDMLKHVESSMPGVHCRLDIVPICTCVGIDVSAFPDMEYTIDGKKYFMPKESIMLKSGDACYMKIMHNPTLPFYLLGLIFFQNYYTIFDQENKRLGFAESIHAHPRVRELRELSEGV